MIHLSHGDPIDQFREAIGKRFGLLLDDSHRPFLGEFLARLTGAAGVADAASFVQRLRAGELPRDEQAVLVNALTVGETYFFRHADQLRAFTDEVFHSPEILPGPRRRLHVLSAGCASGEEAYSLAILIRENVPDNSNWDVRVVGVDINPTSLAKAARARYTSWSLRGMAEHIRIKYFQPVDREFALNSCVQAMVSFEERNLCDSADLLRPGAFDVIFCRNVLMYFTPEALATVIGSFTQALVPLGLLFLGPAETLRGISNDYNLRHRHDAFYYQLRPQGGGVIDHPVLQQERTIPVVPDGSWVTAIGQAAERIAQLRWETHAPRPDAPTTPVTRAPAFAPQSSLPAVREMIHQERYADALSVLGALTDDERRDPDAKLLLAVSLTNSGAVDAAESLCHEILAGDELNAEARYLLALCLEHTGRNEGAVEQDETAIYLDPRFAMPHLHLGLLGKRAGDREGAGRAFRRALALLPREDAGRILLFGGGFTREMLFRICEAELDSCGGGA